MSFSFSRSLYLGAMSLTLMVSLLSRDAHAFPEMVRHNYVNCTTCHVSPTGGGILTQYGRELSKEVLSTSGKDGEQAFLYGVVKPPEWLNMGGDIRGMAFYRDSPTAREGHAFPMQTDIEAAIAYKKLIIDGVVGYKGEKKPINEPITKKIISRQHYINFRPTDETSLRGGKFRTAYGINTPDHVLFIKRGLGWDQGTETYNVEAAYIGDRFNVYATGVFGRPDAPELNRETGGALAASVSFLDSYKTGVSYFYGANNLARRHIAGPWGILGFTPHFFLLTEFDFQGSTPKTGPSLDTQWGMVNYSRLDYEFFQGFHGYLTQELSRLDFGNPDTLSKNYGIGIQFFPRPHLELNLSWQMQTTATVAGYTDFLFLLFHFYL